MDNPGTFADLLKTFIERPNADTEPDVPETPAEPVHGDLAAENARTASPRPSAFKFNFDGANAKFRGAAPTPADVRRAFSIQDEITVTRRDKTFVEVDNQFAPELVPGTYVVAVVVRTGQRPSRSRAAAPSNKFKFVIPLERDQGETQEISIEVPPNGVMNLAELRWFSTNKTNLTWVKESNPYLVRSSGEMTPLCGSNRVCNTLRVAPGDTFTVLVNPENSDRLQFGQIENGAIPCPEAEEVSVPDVSMAGRAVFWVMFLDFLSLIKESFVEDVTLTPYDKDKKYTQLICPTSLKSCLHQLIKSTKAYIQQQTLFTNTVFRQGHVFRSDNFRVHFTASVQLLTLLDGEILELLGCLSDHLKVSAVNEDTVDLIYGLRNLRVEDVSETLTKLTDAAAVYEFMAGAADKVLPNIQDLTAQRKHLNQFIDRLGQFGDMNGDSIPQLVQLLQAFKDFAVVELGAGKVSEQVFARLHDQSDTDQYNTGVSYFYCAVFAMWKAIGMTVSGAQNRGVDMNFDAVRQDVLSAQSFAEIAFLENDKMHASRR